jgi:hypothetical protein
MNFPSWVRAKSAEPMMPDFVADRVSEILLAEGAAAARALAAVARAIVAAQIEAGSIRRRKIDPDPNSQAPRKSTLTPILIVAWRT